MQRIKKLHQCTFAVGPFQPYPIFLYRNSIHLSGRIGKTVLQVVYQFAVGGNFGQKPIVRGIELWVGIIFQVVLGDYFFFLVTREIIPVQLFMTKIDVQGEFFVVEQEIIDFVKM